MSTYFNYKYEHISVIHVSNVFLLVWSLIIKLVNFKILLTRKFLFVMSIILLNYGNFRCYIDFKSRKSINQNLSIVIKESLSVCLTVCDDKENLPHVQT